MIYGDDVEFPHACPEMVRHLREGVVGIKYVNFTREYALDCPGSPGSIQLIHFCPWCGAKLPKDLRNTWGDALDELGLLNPFGDDREKVPKEFWSDVWWRRRGL